MLRRRAASLSIIGAISRRRAKLSGDFDDEYSGQKGAVGGMKKSVTSAAWIVTGESEKSGDGSERWRDCRLRIQSSLVLVEVLRITPRRRRGRQRELGCRRGRSVHR